MKNFFLNFVLLATFVTAAASVGQAASFGYLRDAPGGDGRFLENSVVEGAGYINSWNGKAGTFDFELSLNGPNGNYFDLLTYCADPFRSLSVGPEGGEGGAFQIISMNDYLSDADDRLAIQKLWGLAFIDSLTSATNAAAFQFLLWEYIGDSTFDLSNGSVRVTDKDVFAQATAWNDQLSTASGLATLLVLDGRGEDKQSFFYEENAVPLVENPEPGTYGLIGAGLLALGYFRRKR